VEQFKAELQNSEREISEYDKLLEEADRENKLLKDKYEQANQELEEQRTRTAQLASDVEKRNDKYVAKLEKTSRELKDTWAVRFSRFEFSSKALRFAASLPLDERLEVERYLVELDSAENPCAHTRGKMRGQGGVQHDFLRLGPNKPGRIQFNVKNGVIHVVEIYPRKDQDKTDRQY
jgi:septal ring factor EnvC (AmiA/AmiB activator)